MFVFAFLVSIGIAQAECEDWQGIISSSHPILTQTKRVNLVVGENNTGVELAVGDIDCIEQQTCSWSLDTELGSLSEGEIEGVYIYTPPTALEDCTQPNSVVVRLDCENASEDSFVDAAEVSLTCEDFDPDNPSNWTATGGGCNSPSFALVLPFFLLFRKRRQD